jgi:transcription elongation GreA/GreB family factor
MPRLLHGIGATTSPLRTCADSTRALEHPMSRAFTREPDDGDAPALPDIPLSEHPNYVTPRGMAQLRARLQAANARHDALKASADTLSLQNEMAPLERELRWLNARMNSAIEVDLLAQPEDRVAFGASVTLGSSEGEQHYDIVGEDEADAEQHRVSYLSPLAQALLGARVGDEVNWKRPAGDLPIEVIAIDYDSETRPLD